MKKRFILSATIGLSAAATTVLATPALAAEGGLKLLSFTTLLGEILSFAVLVWVMMKFVWPPLMRAIETRQKEISDGLAAAEQGRQSLADADARREELMKDARGRASVLLAEGEQRKSEVVAAAKGEAESERARILESGRRELDGERAAMRREMAQKLGGLVVVGAARILQREVDSTVHTDIVSSLQKEL